MALSRLLASVPLRVTDLSMQSPSVSGCTFEDWRVTQSQRNMPVICLEGRLRRVPFGMDGSNRVRIA